MPLHVVDAACVVCRNRQVGSSQAISTVSWWLGPLNSCASGRRRNVQLMPLHVVGASCVFVVIDKGVYLEAVGAVCWWLVPLNSLHVLH